MKPSEASTPTDTSVLLTRIFDAPVELIWRAYTEPELFARWCLGPPGWSMPVCQMDVCPGGLYRWRWRNDEDGKEFGFVGEFQEVVSQTKLVHPLLPRTCRMVMHLADEGIGLQYDTRQDENGRHRGKQPAWWRNR